MRRKEGVYCEWKRVVGEGERLRDVIDCEEIVEFFKMIMI